MANKVEKSTASNRPKNQARNHIVVSFQYTDLLFCSTNSFVTLPDITL